MQRDVIHIFGTSFAAITLAVGLLASQDRYVRAEENANHDLAITRSTGEQIVVSKSDRKWVNETQVAFESVAISSDGAAIGWTAYYSNCCTSYPAPVFVEVYKSGIRHTFKTVTAPSHWCFVDDSRSVAVLSTTLHGPQHQVLELWDVSTEQKRGEFIWMEGDAHPEAPAWVVALRQTRAAKTHQCMP